MTDNNSQNLTLTDKSNLKLCVNTWLNFKECSVLLQISTYKDFFLVYIKLHFISTRLSQ